MANAIGESIGEFSVSISMDIGEVALDNSSIRELYFVEDVFSFCITGKMIFTDQRGLFEFGPLTGNEKITLIYGEGEEDKELVFYIYKVSKVEQANETMPSAKQNIELFFVDTMFYSLNYNQWSKSWTDKKISFIVKDIATNYLGITKWDQWEPTSEELDYFYMPYWTPHTALKWLIQRGKGKLSGQAGYCMYNNPNGSNFVTLDTLLNNTSNADPDNYVFTDTDLFLSNKILQWSLSGVDMLALKKLSGGTLYGYDSMTKTFLTKTFKYKNSVKNHTILGNKTLFPDYSETNMIYKNTEERTLDNINTLYHNTWNKTYDIQQVLSIVVRGHEKRYSGQLIHVEWPSKNDSTEKYNKNLSGHYFVKSITHHFSGFQNPHYRQKLLCIKNGYEDSDARNLVKSTKKNIS